MTAELTDEAKDTLLSLVEVSEEKLHQAGAAQAELGFGLGCGAGFGPLALVILILFVLKVINLILAIFLWLLAALALLGVASLIAMRSRKNKIEKVYRQEVYPEIERSLHDLGIEQSQFEAAAWQALPDGAVLLTLLKPLPPEEEQSI